MAARKHRPPATLAAVSFSCKYRTEKNAAPPATPTSLRSAGCTVGKLHHRTSASNSPHGQLPARLHCIVMQPKDWETFLGSGKSNLPKNCVHYNCRKPALPKTATRLQESYSTPLKRTIHIPSGTHILRCINIQPRNWETFLGSGKPNLAENHAPSNGHKPALFKTSTRLRGLKTPHLLAATHVQNRATSLR